MNRYILFLLPVRGFVVTLIMFLFGTGAVYSQQTTFRNITSINVGTKNPEVIKAMFTMPHDEYYYAVFKDVKIKKVQASSVIFKIRKADSLIVDLTIKTGDAGSSKKLFRQACKEFGKPKQKVYTSPTTFDWIWDEIKKTGFIESKSLRNPAPGQSEFKVILINS